MLVFKEPDFGTTLVFVAIMLGMLFVYGIPWQHFVWMAIAVAVTVALVFSILPGLGVQVRARLPDLAPDGLPASQPDTTPRATASSCASR